MPSLTDFHLAMDAYGVHCGLLRLTGYPVPGVALDLTIAKSTVDALAEFCDRPVSTYPEVICALQAVLPDGRNSNL